MKYIGVVLLVLVGLLVNSSWDYFQSFIRPANASVAVEGTIIEMLKQTRVTAEDKNSIKIVAESIKKLQQQEFKASDSYSNLVGLPVINGVELPVYTAKVEPVSRPQYISYNKYEVSMVVVTPTKRYAVVDGRFVKEGDTLSGKDKLQKISVGKISVLQHGKLNTIAVSGAKL